MDVKKAFLNGDLDEEIYMEYPEGYVLPGNEQKVCKLVKSLYDLKQALKQWHQKFDLVILSNGFIPNSCDKCLYTKVHVNIIIFMCLYVDDMLIINNKMKGILETKRFLTSTFKMKDLELVDTILGIKVKQNSEGYELNQTHYIEKILAQLEYESAIGYSMYLMQCTRPGMSFVVSKMSGFTSNLKTLEGHN